MARLLVRYRDAGAIRWGELEGTPPRQPKEVTSVLPLASDAKTTSDILSWLDRAEVGRGPRVEVSADRLLSPVTPDAQILRKV